MSRRFPVRPSRGRTTRRQASKEDEIPDVYQEMLEEAEKRYPEQFRPDGPGSQAQVRRKRYKPQISTDGAADKIESDESDVEWEDVTIPTPAVISTGVSVVESAGGSAVASRGDDEILAIDLVPGSESQQNIQKRKQQRQKRATQYEKNLRIEFHKLHVLCLVGHVSLRNNWCNSRALKLFLSPLNTEMNKMFLNSQEKNWAFHLEVQHFIRHLKVAVKKLVELFRVTKSGLTRAEWAENDIQLTKREQAILAHTENFEDKKAFISQAQLGFGSRDFIAQLLCALLRDAGVKTRLVCSLQALSISSTQSKVTSFHTQKKCDNTPPSSISLTQPSRVQRPGRSTIFSRTALPSRPAMPSRPSTEPVLTSRPADSEYPVFWVEVFDKTSKKWMPIDPFSKDWTWSVGSFEPPATHALNKMSYVVAFDEDGSAKDVTKRYAKAFNTRTFQYRVESTPGGEEWWNNVMNHYKKPLPDEHSEAEDIQMAEKVAAEPMPTSYEGFRKHPIFVLERDLKEHEVVYPKTSSSIFSFKEKQMPVYRRANVHTVKSPENWFHLGRVVKEGQTPLKDNKRIKSGEPLGFCRIPWLRTPTPGLYAEWQTDIYQPPPVVDGKIPTNDYGNVDLYVSSMVPSGGLHISDPNARQAAKILGIHSAQAVIGFNHSSRHQSTPILAGIVIASEYREALEEVLIAMKDDQLQKSTQDKTNIALQAWRDLLLKLRIREKVKAYASEDEDSNVSLSDEDMDDVYNVEEADVDDAEEVEKADNAGGGFLSEQGSRSRRLSVTPWQHFELKVVPNEPKIDTMDNSDTVPLEPIIRPDSPTVSLPDSPIVSRQGPLDPSSPNSITTPASVSAWASASEDDVPDWLL
ncbi:hypothetical protein N7495_004271 [Penicillium taxi]|uniref:uncharacterized protein n=1 Tax=Penicillium taxi TaxID=168475 RepID=UPI002544E7FA|nr:uncharacterized protein N7495_004271 [Penicillium taxi]KAJ5899527.1 hypothetical protein N7495_004271 [Penicillium taxi]